MALSRIKGQDRAVGYLMSAFESGRLSHAYLFQGPDGVGKETTALAFAQALNCEAGGLDGCGQCRACKMAAGLSHPDIHLIFPVPTTIKPAEMAELLADYTRDGFRDVDFGRKSAIISVDTILSEMVAKANQKPYLGPWKVFVVADADAMTTEAANTLLKTLEEPPDQTIIILTTSRPNALPVTVVSRCQSVPFAALSRAVVREVLLSDGRLSFDEASASTAALLAQGSAGNAVRMEKRGPTVDIDRVAELMIGKRTRDVPSLINEANGLAFRLGRAEQERILELMLLWFRDVLSVSQLGRAAEKSLLYSRHQKELSAQADTMDVETVGRMVDRIDDARRAIERYSNPTIVFTSVLLDIAMARKQATSRRGRSHAA
ncbi:MAG: DNA polymerase III subunit delta' [Candidatus Eisenbacteria bacterium]|nr:DNA polymerase III subunit delta' [Candidatus Eisenbacteria bacterium]